MQIVRCCSAAVVLLSSIKVSAVGDLVAFSLERPQNSELSAFKGLLLQTKEKCKLMTHSPCEGLCKLVIWLLSV